MKDIVIAGFLLGITIACLTGLKYALSERRLRKRSENAPQLSDPI